ncbi:hypothetical protein B0H11DRAFT_1998536, partial [Mycena galericulata]
MRFTTCVATALSLLLSLSSPVLGEPDIVSQSIPVTPTTTISFHPIPSCPPICRPIPVERSCIRGRRCLEERVVCVFEDIACPQVV